jgi:hypothetical protein
MKTRLFFPIIFIVSFLAFTSCENFISPNLKKKEVVVLAPGEGVHLTTNAVDFWWEELKGAEYYDLQIVSPSFSAVQKMVLDTPVIDNHFVFQLQPGTYQWRVRGTNNASSTAYITRTLYVDSIYVDSTSSLTTQTVLLSSPTDNYLSNSLSQIFRWDPLYSAEEYRIQIINQLNGSTVTDAIVEVDTFSYTLSAGTFKWQVRAQNATSNTAFSSRIIRIDVTAPIVSSPSSPATGSSIVNPVTLQWTRFTGTMADSLFIYSDSLISAPVYNELHNDTSFVFSGTPGEDYFWRLRSADSAGNHSGYSSLFKFILQ